MEVSFPGGLEVEALQAGFQIRTDQPAWAGGGGEAPSPFDLFLASIGTCAGFYALGFCRQRDVPTDGLALSLEPEWDEEVRRVVRIRIEVATPAGFPEKYRDALLRAIDQCSVKRHLKDPPRFEVVLRQPAAPTSQAIGTPAMSPNA